MAFLPTGLFGVQQDKIDESKITRLSANLEVRRKASAVEEDPDSTDEEVRWVLSCDVEQTLENVTNIDIATNQTQTATISGRIRGGSVLTLQPDSAYFTNGNWRITKDEVVGINDDGSLQAVQSQTWIAVSEWIDAEWNESGS
jgi:hypothetical protein